MNFDNWQTVATVFFFIGMAAGLLLCFFLVSTAYKMGIFRNVLDCAAKLAENSRLAAEIAVSERRLVDLRQRFGAAYAAVSNAGEQAAVSSDGKVAGQ